MTVSDDVYIRKLEKQYGDLERDYLMLQETLAFILLEIGEPVTLRHSTVTAGLPEGTRIFIDEDKENQDHTIGLTVESDKADPDLL